MDDRVVDDPAAALDLAKVGKLLDDLLHPTLALAQMAELVRCDLDSADLKRKSHRHPGRLPRGGEPEAIRSPRGELRGTRRGRSIALPQGATSAEHPQLVVDYADGLTQVQIAEKHRLHIQTVRKRLITAGIDTRARLRALTDEDLRAVRVAMDDGASVREIACGLGVAHTTVTRSLARRREAPESPFAHHSDAARAHFNPSSGAAITIAHHIGNTL